MAELLLLELLLLELLLELELFDPPDLDADLAILSSLRPLKPLRAKRGSGVGDAAPRLFRGEGRGEGFLSSPVPLLFFVNK